MARNPQKKRYRPLFMAVGALLCGHFAYVLAFSALEDRWEDALWMSHVGTLAGGLGALSRRRKLMWVALVSLLVNHGMWIADTLVWLMTGRFVFGFASYLEGAGVSDWVQSANHFFTVPSLLFLCALERGREKWAWAWAGALFSVLCVAGYYSPAEMNINCSHAPWPGMDKMFPAWMLGFTGLGQVAFASCFQAFGNYLPTNVCLGYVYKRLFGERAAPLLYDAGSADG